MNNYDCFWWEAVACYPDTVKQCENCKYRLQPGQNQIVDDFYEERTNDIERALAPVDDKWVARFELYKHLFENHEL